MSRLLVLERDDDQELMLRVARELLADPPRALPSHMRVSLHAMAAMVIDGDYDRHVAYVYAVLLAVQARPPGESAETIMLRLELESIFMVQLFGSPQRPLERTGG